MVSVLVDNRLRMQEDSLPEGLGMFLRGEFEHSNPSYFRQRARVVAWGRKRGRSIDPKTIKVRGEPETIKSWQVQEGELSFPRGGTTIVRKAFERFGLGEPAWDDRRLAGSRSKGMQLAGYEHRVDLWEHQIQIVDAAMERENCLVRAETGCLAGDAVIGINRNGKGFAMPIAELVRMFNGGTSSNRTWDLNRPTMVRARLDDGTIGLVQLVDAYVSGMKMTYRMTLESGQSIKATADHRILSSNGWKRLGQLSVGDEVFVEDDRRPTKRGTQRTRKDRKLYLVRVAKYHPFAGRLNVKNGGHSVPLHRLVVEANLNGQELDTFVKMLNLYEKLDAKFVDPKTHVVHHRDGDSLNNELSNLELMTIAQHKKIHEALATRQLRSRTVLTKIASIEQVGEEETFDLSMAGPNNFVANGVVVHNSGKTSAAIALAVKVGLPTIIIVWSANLFEQWMERLTIELGIDPGEIGQIRGSKRTLGPITMAMQQTLYANPTFTAKIAPKFGCVMADEVQRFAARTFNDVIDKFPARYRIGFSADEHRKDKKEFLIYDAFGAVAVDIGRDEVVKRKLVLDVEVRVIPTEFRADWYCEQQRSESPDFNRLLEEMVKDKNRNLTATSIARTMMGLGHQVLMLTHRREHAASFVRAEIESGTRAGLLLGGPENEAEFASTVKAIRARELKLAAGTYQAIGQGMDVPSVSRGVACTPIASNKQFFGQVRGRLCRKCDGKKDAVLYYLWDKNVFGIEPILNLRKWNRVVMIESDDGWLSAEDFIVEWNKQRKK